MNNLILIIENDPGFREALAEMIRAEGFQVETATNGMDALDELRWGLRPRMIFLDMQMQVMTGWDFRAEQKKTPELAAIPVVAMTAGYWKDQDRGDFAVRLAKPFSLEDLKPLLEG